jgi:uncharacterized protein YndB with AHSA1/START domain
MNPTVITVSSTVNAPVELAWQAFTQPEHITKWNFASSDWECPAASNDMREGGVFSYTMAAKDGSVSFDFGGRYTHVTPLERIEYTMFDDRKAQVTFEPISSTQTRVTEAFEMEHQNSEELQRTGWGAILEQYKQHVESLGA